MEKLQQEYRQLELKYYQLWQGLDRRVFALDGGWFNAAFERAEDGWRPSQAYSIKGYCDVEERFYEKLMLHTMAENSLFIRQLSA